MVGLSVMSTFTATPSAGAMPATMSPSKKRPADEPLLDPDRTLHHKRSRTSLRPNPVALKKNLQPHARDSVRGLQDDRAFQTQLERSISLILAAEGFDGATPAAMESFRAITEQFSLHFLDFVRSSMIISGRTTPTPFDFIIALNHFDLTPSNLEPHMELPSLPSITQPSISVDTSTDTVPAKLDKVLGPDLVITASSDELRSIQTERMRTKFRSFVPTHFPDLPSMHTWRSTAVWATDRGDKAEQGQADARNVRERATKEGVMAEQALRRLLIASKKSKKDGEEQGDRNVSETKKSKVQTAWERARETILAMDKEAREQEEAEEAAVAAEFDEPDPVLDVLSDALEPKAPPSWRKAKRMVEEEQRMEDEDEELMMVVNCDRKYWREGARGRH